MHSKVTLQRDNLTQTGKVKGVTLSSDGSIIVTYNGNLLLNNLTHGVEFEDGDDREYMSNIIGAKI